METTRRELTIVCLLLVLAGCSCPRNVPPYGISFHFDHSGWSLPDREAYQDGEPIMARGRSWKRHKNAPPPSMSPGQHWLTLVVRDPDGLAYRWRRGLTKDEYVKELKRWREEPRGHHFSFNLRDWVPEGFRWRLGMYRVSGLMSAQGRDFTARGGAIFMKEVPPRFRKPTPPLPRIGPAEPLLRAGLKVNRNAFKPGEIIVLEGFVTNVSSRPFMLQTRLPFLEAKLLASGHDFFPASRPEVQLRLSDFSRLGPGEKRLFFRESFVAGQLDPDWVTGIRSEWFPAPFAKPPGKREVWFVLSSAGLFPRDRQPADGIWTGEVESNRVLVNVE